MPSIKSLHARQILDSRGNPTVEVDCMLDDGSFGRAAVPSGASTGAYEALELRDGDQAVYGGKSVMQAVHNVEEKVFPILRNMDSENHRSIDETMIQLDGTKNKSSLGANAILGVSMAVCRARAVSQSLPLYQSLATQYGFAPPRRLPIPLMNVLNGGKHADSGLSFQECMIVPVGFPTFAEALRAGVEIFHALKFLLCKAGHVTAVGDEGGFAPHLRDSREALSFLSEAIHKAGYEGRVKMALDAAASECLKDGSYGIDGRMLSASELTKLYMEIAKDFGIVSIEDSHSEDDWAGFAGLVGAANGTLQVVGDDLFVTNVHRITMGIEKKAANAVLIKLNQIGTVSETIDAIQLTQKAGWAPVISHRSGETEDTFIAHLSVAVGASQIKTGSLSRTDRMCKYNELLRIEEELGSSAVFKNPFA